MAKRYIVLSDNFSNGAPPTVLRKESRCQYYLNHLWLRSSLPFSLFGTQLFDHPDEFGVKYGSVADSVAGGWGMSGHSFSLVCVTSYTLVSTSDPVSSVECGRTRPVSFVHVVI